MPEGFEYLWEWFRELDAARGSSGFGANPIAFVEIDAWARLTMRSPTPWDVRVLKQLDIAYLNAQARKPTKPAKPAAAPKGKSK